MGGVRPPVSGDLVPRRYSEKQAGEILRRAAGMQRAEPSAADPSGFSLAELEDVAREAGIDPALVRRAASEVEASRAHGFGDALAGSPTTIRLEAHLAGEFPAERFDELVPIIQTSTSWQGHAGVVGRTLTWSARADSNTSSLQVFVSAGDGRSLIRIEERLGGLAGGLFGGLIGGIGGGAGAALGGSLGTAAGSLVVGFAIPAALIVGSFFMARAIFAAHSRTERRKLQDLLDQLTAHARTAIDQTTPRLGEPD